MNEPSNLTVDSDKRSKTTTPYQKWLDEKRKEEGCKGKCPRCGTEYIDLPFIVGEECKKCGFPIDKFDDVEKEMASRDEEIGLKTPFHLSLQFKESDMMSGQSLAIPALFLEEPIPEFEYIFKNGTATTQYVYAIAYFIVVWIVIGYQIWFTNIFHNLLMLAALAIAGISIFTGFANVIKVTTIKVNNNGARFSGWFASTSMNYEEIISINNQREVTIWASICSYFDLTSFPYYWRERLHSNIFIDRPYGPGSSSLFSSEPASGISTSASYINKITISTPERSVDYQFVGAGNQSFIKALAIIIYLARKHNRGCHVDPSAIRAAEKGEEDFTEWQQHHKSPY